MAKCKFCDTETQLYESGVPICIACADSLDRGQRPKPTPANTESGEEDQNRGAKEPSASRNLNLKTN
jgi:hypothetical protein